MVFHTLFFRDKMEEIARSKKSNIVLALDFPFEKPENRGKLFAKAEKVLESVKHYICAVKINHHLIIPLGTFGDIQKILKKTHSQGLMAIMDCKANDIGSTNKIIAEYYYAAGFDALIANPFIGWEEGLKPIFEVARKLQRGVILLTYMSHKGTSEGYGQSIYDTQTGEKTLQYISFARKALRWKADGVVVGATYPEKIRKVYEVLGEKIPIYSPGIGVQGGKINSAVKAGTRYFIVGRTITLAENPAKIAKQMTKSF